MNVTPNIVNYTSIGISCLFYQVLQNAGLKNAKHIFQKIKISSVTNTKPLRLEQKTETMSNLKK